MTDWTELQDYMRRPDVRAAVARQSEPQLEVDEEPPEQGRLDMAARVLKR